MAIKSIKKLTAALTLAGAIFFLAWVVLPSRSSTARAEFITPIPVRESNNKFIPQYLISQTKIVSMGNADLHNSMAADSNGHLHVSFNTANGDKLFYAIYSGTTWYIQPVATGSGIGRNSIAVDLNTNGPHLSYADDEGLKYAHLSGSQWLSQTVCPGIHRQNAIAVDSHGYPHIAYSTDYQVGGGYWFGNVEYTYPYTQWNGTSCGETVYTSGEEIRSPIALVLDSQDNPAILYKKRFFGGDFVVHLQKWISPSWQLTELENDFYNSFPIGAALTIDSHDNYCWTYAWHGQKVCDGTILSPGANIGYSDIAIDSAGRIYVVFEEGTTLQLAVKSACGWVQTTLAPITTWGDVSLVVTQDIVHIIYYDGATGSLKHLSIPVASIIGHLEPLQVQPKQIAADANSTANITAMVNDCVGQPLANMPVTLTISPVLGSAFTYPQMGTIVQGMTGANGLFSATLKAGLETGIITITVAADDMLPQSTSITLTTPVTLTRVYLPVMLKQ